jgi:hypothetical protein
MSHNPSRSQLRTPTRIQQLYDKLAASTVLAAEITPDGPPDRMSSELLNTLTNRELCKLTGSHITSVRCWRRGRTMPLHITKLLQFTALHQLDQLGWRGWRLKDGVLISPNGDCFLPGEIQGIELRKQQLAFLEAEARIFRARPAQPQPDDKADGFLQRIKA